MFERFFRWLFGQPENKQFIDEKISQESLLSVDIEPKLESEPEPPVSVVIESSEILPDTNETNDTNSIKSFGFTDSWDIGWGISVSKDFDEKLPNELPLILNAYIKYLDRDGHFSSRNIIIKKFIQDKENGWINAFCEWRQGNRTFRYNRIQEFIDRDTGEIIELDKIADFLFEKYQESSVSKIDKCWYYYHDIITILVTIARLDGRMMPKERKIIVDFLIDLNAISCEFSTDLDEMIKTYGVGYQSIKSFNKSLREFVENRPDLCEKIYLCIEKIIGTDKKITTEEEKHLNWAKKILIIGE